MRARVFVLTLFFVMLFGEFVSAQNIIGVSPGTVNFKNVLRGGYAERYLTITTPNIEEDIFISAQPRGEIAPWLEYFNNITVSKTRPGKFFVAVRPPNDIPNGNYTGFLRISTGALANAPGGPAVTTVRAALDVAISVEITDLEVMSCTASAFRVESAEKGDDLIFNLNILNQGNVRLNPLVILEIWDQEQISIVQTVEFRANDILPTREQGVIHNLPTAGLEPEQYWVRIKVPDCFSEGFLTFDVLEQGALKSEGVLSRVYSVPWSYVGDTIPIIAEFKNIGEKSVNAKFKGQITLDGKIERVLESEEIGVPVSAIENFTFFFTPNKPGSYVASGRVFYDKKRTFEASGVFNVAPKTFSLKNVLLVLVYVALMFIIAFLLYKVHKERKKYEWKLKGAKFRRFVLLGFFVLIAFAGFVEASVAQFNLNMDAGDSRAVLNEVLRSSGVVFQIVTDRAAVCKYSIYKGVSFTNMEGTFDFSFEKIHKKEFVGLGNGIYNYYVRCRDSEGNVSGELEANFAVSLPVSAQIVLEGGEIIGNGRTKVSLKTSKAVSQTPFLSYSFDGVIYEPIPLFGSGNEWIGYLSISKQNTESVGSFKFQARDLEGFIGSEITSGGVFFVDTKKPSTISNIKATGLVGEIRVNWESDEDNVEEFRIYRSSEPAVDYTDYFKSVKTNSLNDIDVERGRTYYYRVSAVDKAGNIGDLSKEVYATALLNNVSINSGLDLRYLGLVDNFLAEIQQVFFIADNARSSFESKGGKEREIYNFLKLERDINGAKSELDALKREIENYKSQSLGKSELDQKLNSGRLKLNTIKRKIPENLIIVSERSEKRVVNDEALAALVLRLWPDISEQLKNKRVSGARSLMESNGFNVKSDAYNLEVVYMDGTRRSLALIKESVSFVHDKNESVFIAEVVPQSLARSVSELSIRNNDYLVLKEDTIISFPADTKEIIYTLDKHIALDSLREIQTLVVYEVQETVKPASSLTGYFAFIDIGRGSDYVGVIFAIIVIAGLGGYLFFIRRTSHIYEKLIPLKQIIEEAESSLMRGETSVAKDLYHAASLHYKGLEKRLQRKVYWELEGLYKKLSV